MDFESSAPVRGRGKNKRPWTAREDAKLVEALLDLCANGSWKIENRFRNGYLQQLEKVLEEKLPGCGLKAQPHIESRVKTLKTKFNALNEMLLCKSGFSWNDQEKMLVCEKTVYDDWVKTHKDARNLFGKPFPHLNELGEIFGKDCVTGLAIETLADVVEELHKESSDNEDRVNTMTSAGSKDIDISVAQSYSSTPSGVGGSKRPRRKRARQADCLATSFEKMATNIENILKGMVPLFATIAGALQHEKDMAEKTSKVVSELFKIDGLSSDVVMKAANILAAEPPKTLVFLSMPNSLKRQYVESLL